MNLTDIFTIKSILKSNKLHANKKFGQNFLVDKRVLDKIMETAGLSDQDTVVEIGPGLGVLTQELASKAGLVLAIEKDRRFVEWLRKYFENTKNAKIICDDILTYPLNLIPKAYKVVANLPYNITSPVIRMFLESENAPQEMVLMVQKEVAERLVAKPGNRERGITTIMVEFYGMAEIIETVANKSFWPIPEVDSAILRICTKDQRPKTKDIDSKIFFRIVKAGFSQKRRQIHHPLKAIFHLSSDQIKSILKEADIDPMNRAEDLSLENWVKLYSSLLI